MASSPIFTATPQCASVTIPTASYCLATDGSSAGGSGTSIAYLYSVGSNGAIIDRVRVIPVWSGTGSGVVAATCVNIFQYYNVGVPTQTSPPIVNSTSVATNGMIGQVLIPALTIGAAATSVIEYNPYYELPLSLLLPANHHVLVSQMVAQANGVSFSVQLFGGDY